MSFQSAPPHGGRLTFSRAMDCSRSFNPRPRTGGDSVKGWVYPYTEVSIRAPARGATGNQICGRGHSFTCFNPRPRTGGDVYPIDNRTLWNSRFNPRPRTGGDVVFTASHRSVLGVSIRAPARGATRGRCRSTIAPVFQSAPPHGGRRALSHGTLRATEVFQSAPPHGGRLARGGKFTARENCFNPRPRTGGDRGPRKARENAVFRRFLREPLLREPTVTACLLSNVCGTQRPTSVSRVARISPDLSECSGFARRPSARILEVR